MTQGTPKQIENVVDVDRMDSLDRQKLDPRIKLQLLCAEAQATYGRDPRAEFSRMAIVGRPRVILQMMLDLQTSAPGFLELHRKYVVGEDGADTVARYQWCAIIVRCNVKDDRLWCLPWDMIPDSTRDDRQRASTIRMHAHAGTLQKLRED